MCPAFGCSGCLVAQRRLVALTGCARLAVCATYRGTARRCPRTEISECHLRIFRPENSSHFRNSFLYGRCSSVCYSILLRCWESQDVTNSCIHFHISPDRGCNMCRTTVRQIAEVHRRFFFWANPGSSVQAQSDECHGCFLQTLSQERSRAYSAMHALQLM